MMRVHPLLLWSRCCAWHASSCAAIALAALLHPLLVQAALVVVSMQQGASAWPH